MQRLKSSRPLFFDNTERELIIVTPTRLDNLLRDLDEKTKYLGLALGSAGIFITVLFTLVTTNPQDRLGIPAAGWQGFFVTLLIGSFFTTLFFINKYKKTSNFDRKALIGVLVSQSPISIEKIKVKTKK